MSAECPVCFRRQDAGLLCSACCDVLEMELGDVAAIVTELDTTLSRQARIGASGPGGLASEKNPINTGAMQVAEDLQNTLTTWARDVAGDRPEGPDVHPTRLAAWLLLMHIDAIRKHPAVEELHDEVIDAIRQARRVVDRPAERQFVGPCLAVHQQVTCTEDLYARPGATHVRCGVCGTEHDVAERRAWLLEQAWDRIVTVREAAQWVGRVGDLDVTEDRIRGYIRRGTLGLRSLNGETKALRLGDLLTLVLGDHEKRSA